MNRKSIKERARILRCLVEGNSIRATARLNDCVPGTVLRLLKDVGFRCLEYQYNYMTDLKCRHIELDEIWAFVLKKKRLLDRRDTSGDIWTYIGICRECKIVPYWHIGPNNSLNTELFLAGLIWRLSDGVSLYTDGNVSYIDAIDKVSRNCRTNHAMLIKHHSSKKLRLRKLVIHGDIIKDQISTSSVERHNLTLRMSSRRFTRKTNGFSKNLEYHRYALGLHFMYYNFVRVHRSLDTTPACRSGIMDREWTLVDLLNL